MVRKVLEYVGLAVKACRDVFPSASVTSIRRSAIVIRGRVFPWGSAYAVIAVREQASNDTLQGAKGRFFCRLAMIFVMSNRKARANASFLNICRANVCFEIKGVVRFLATRFFMFYFRELWLLGLPSSGMRKFLFVYGRV